MPLIELTLGNLLEQQAESYPNQEAIVYPEQNFRVTYNQFNKIVDQAAKSFLAIDVKKNDHVAIWSDNKFEWLVTQFATAKIGAVLVTVNTNYQTTELEYLLKQSNTKVLVMDTKYKNTSYIDVLTDVCPNIIKSNKEQINSIKLPYLKQVIMLGDYAPDFAYTWDELMAKNNEITDTQLIDAKSNLHCDDVINMQYTSGTTGFPKGVMLSHHNILNNAKQIGKRMKLTHLDRLCIPVPFFHTFGCVLGILTAVTSATTIVIVEQFNAEEVLKAVSSEKCTALHGVPTMFIAELNHPNFDNYDLSHLRTGIMAGSTCPIEVMQDVMNIMGVNEITICYGLTETSPVIYQTKTDDPIELRVSTVGQIHPYIEAKIINPDTKEECGPNEPGELITRGYHVMKGYYNNLEATKETIDSDGWLWTGDLAVADENNYIKINGRNKDMIIRGGENIYPREIEEFLYSHQAILDVQVVGVPDEKYGEEIMAWIILKEGINVSDTDIREYCLNKISYHKIPKYIEFISEYPMTASGKIQKYRLQEMGKKLIEV